METSIKIKTKQGTIITGILLKEDSQYFCIKLSSGYNANILKENCQVLEKTDLKKKSTPNQHNPKTISKKEELPNISILHTGGTIASKVDYETGAVSSKFTAEELLDLYPELHSFANLKAKMIGNLMSEDLRFEHYNALLESINEEIKQGVDAIIISHGTDTMHYTSAFLHYSLQHLPIPIILIGSQRSSDRPSADGFLHLQSTIQYIQKTFKDKKQFRRVGICMHDSLDDNDCVLLDGINVKKTHSTKRDAFKQLNELPFARLSKDGDALILREELLSEKPNEDFSFIKANPNLKIGFFKAHPNLFPEEIQALSIYDGVVIEGTGLGHLAVSEFDEISKKNLENLNAIKELSKTTKIIIGTQCGEGVVNLNVYSSGRRLKEANIFYEDEYRALCSESLFAKLVVCLSQEEMVFEEFWKIIS
jgi:glutamyl-tRNA(Gln) amidotransferase subunit D